MIFEFDDSIQNGTFQLREGVVLHYFKTEGEGGEEHVRLVFNRHQDVGSWSIIGIGPDLMDFFYRHREEIFLNSLETMIQKYPQLRTKIQAFLQEE